MKIEIHEIVDDTEPHYPCWLFRPDCGEWEWRETPLLMGFVRVLFTHWSPGGRPEAPPGTPYGKVNA